MSLKALLLLVSVQVASGSFLTKQDKTFYACCRAHAVPSHCAIMCTYNIETVLNKQVLCNLDKDCLMYVSEWLHCAQDGNDAAPCARKILETRDLVLPHVCADTFATGPPPPVNEILEQGFLAFTCIPYGKLIVYCYDKLVQTSWHKNVCLRKGSECPTFNHFLSDDAKIVVRYVTTEQTKLCKGLRRGQRKNKNGK